MKIYVFMWGIIMKGFIHNSTLFFDKKKISFNNFSEINPQIFIMFFYTHTNSFENIFFFNNNKILKFEYCIIT